jgi:hypothetical protein
MNASKSQRQGLTSVARRAVIAGSWGFPASVEFDYFLNAKVTRHTVGEVNLNVAEKIVRQFGKRYFERCLNFGFQLFFSLRFNNFPLRSQSVTSIQHGTPERLVWYLKIHELAVDSTPKVTEAALGAAFRVLVTHVTLQCAASLSR